MKYFENKVVWVTGASSGIGKETAIQLAGQGAFLILSARNEDELLNLKSQLAQAEKHFVLVLDLEKSAGFSNLVSRIIAKFGTIDLLINNGGISQRANASETPLETDRRIMEINYFGNIALTKAVLPYFQKQKSGQIVVVSSIAGKFGFYLRSAYSASKHALHGFYESLALEEAKNNIHVTIACPGKINTEISKHALTASGSEHGIMDHNQSTGMSVQECVSVLLRAVEKKQREVLIGKREIKAVLIRRLLPVNLFWKIISKQKAS